MAFLVHSQAQGVSGEMNNLPKHHGAGPPEARSPMQLHRLKAGPDDRFSKHFEKCSNGEGQVKAPVNLPGCQQWLRIELKIILEISI